MRSGEAAGHGEPALLPAAGFNFFFFFFYSSCTQGGGVKLARTFPVRLLVGVVQVVPLVRRVKLVHVDVEVVWRLPEVVLALVQRQADSRGGELFTLAWASLQGQSGGRGYRRRRSSAKALKMGFFRFVYL